MRYITVYTVIPTSKDSGFMEMVPRSSSFDEIGDRTEHFLYDYFDQFLTEQHRLNYVESLAEYSCCCYFLQFKDRHNGNILLLEDGRLAHIDFGFFFDTAPGGKFSFETAPFKLTKSDIRLCGGEGGVLYEYFRLRFRQNMLLARLYCRDLPDMLRLYLGRLPGVRKSASIDRVLEKMMNQMDGQEMCQECDRLIKASADSVGTGMYDQFQARQNGINH